MRINELYVTTAIALILGFALGALVFRRDSTSKPGNADQKGDVKNESWTFSMHPSVRSPKPNDNSVGASSRPDQSGTGFGADGNDRDSHFRRDARSDFDGVYGAYLVLLDRGDQNEIAKFRWGIVRGMASSSVLVRRN